MNFFELEEYGLSDIQRLIDNEIEEDLHLDYKDGRALSKEDTKRTEITKDVSAFANSDGGIIIYGVSEVDHKPSRLSPFDGRVYTKEWLEQVIQRIGRRVKGVLVIPIRIDEDISQTIYIVKIPRSNDSPHMADDHKYYKRFNFSSIPMEEYEVRESFNRKLTPSLVVDDCRFYRSEKDDTDDEVAYKLTASVYNNSNNVGEYYKLNAIFNEDFSRYSFSYKPIEEKISYTVMHLFRVKVSMPSKEFIYPYELLDLGHLTIKVDRSYETTFVENLILELNLYYQGGSFSALFVPKTNKLITEKTTIEDIIEQTQQKIYSLYESRVKEIN